jgi:two-component sensor histidine kinase
MFSASAYAGTQIDSSKITGRYDNFKLKYIEDVSNNLTYKDVKVLDFTKSISNRFTFGFLDHPVWFKFKINNLSTESKKYIFALDEVFYDYVFLYYEQGGEEIRQKSGVQVDLSQREINNPNAHFYITLDPQKTTTIYVKARPFFATFGEFFIYEKDYYHNNIHKDSFIYVFYLGAVLIIAFYNFFLYFYLRNRVYLYYFGYSLSFGLWTCGFFGGMAFYYIPIEYDYNLHIVTPLAILFLMLFSNEVLEVPKNHPRTYTFLKLHQYLLVLSAFLILFYDKLEISFKIGFEFTNLVAGYIFFFYIYFALKQISASNKVAILYLVAIGTFLISITILSLMTIGVFPNTFFTRYGFLFGSFLEIVLLSLLLAYRIDIFQKDYQKKLQNEIDRQTKDLNEKNTKLTLIISQKEDLLKEMFHRVKNNFQILISMLYLEISDENSKSVIKKIENTISKVHSMSIVHDLLYGKSDDGFLEMDEFFENLVKHLALKDLQVNLNIDNFSLRAEVVKDLGLVVNELYINSVKYTSHDHKLNIDLKIKKEGQKILFKYEDNSLGYSDKESGYGTEFIKETLQKFEDVKIEIDTSSKISYKVEFKLGYP